MKLSKQDAISMLVCLFDDNKLTFRNMALLKSVFDEAIEACNEERSEKIAEQYNKGFYVPDTLPDRDIEDDFYLGLQAKAESTLNSKGIIASGKALDAITELLAEESGYSVEDFFYDV